MLLSDSRIPASKFLQLSLIPSQVCLSAPDPPGTQFQCTLLAHRRLESGEVDVPAWRVHIPPQAKIKWPVLPHNQYVKDGKAKPEEGRIVVTLPFDKDLLTQEVTVEVP